MSDIFISYAREDRERAEKLARAFGAQGWSVWWDREILAGQAFDQTIERELAASKCVVVLWSKHSINSEWVRGEAAAGAERGILVPACLDEVKLPLEFSRRQTVDLTDWHGEPAHSGFQQACAAVSALLGGKREKQELLRPEPTRRGKRTWIAGGIGLLAIIVAVYQFGPRLIQQPAHRPAVLEPATRGGELADLVAGTYLGHIVADSKGSSRSDVIVAVQKLSATRVRIRSSYQRIGAFEVELTKIGDNLYNVGGDSPFIGYASRNPPEVELTAHGEVSFTGRRQTIRR